MRKTYFNFAPGRIVANKYEIVRLLGAGWEGEVYLLRERSSGIERAGKFFYPKRNLNNRTINRYANQLHKLRYCPILIQYYAQDALVVHREKVSFLISEFVEGDILSQFLARQPGKRLHPFPALHLLYSLVTGIEDVHRYREYHGDLHMDNIIVHRHGLGFDLKVLDLFHWSGQSKPDLMRDDLCDMIRIFYDALGGAQQYAKHPPTVKRICCGLKRSLILKRYRSAGKLREALETLAWD